MKFLTRLRTILASTTLLALFSFALSIEGEQRVVFIIAEDEYRAAETLPKFAADHLPQSEGYQVSFLTQDSSNKYRIPGMAQVAEADLVVLYVRRRSLPPEDMAHFRNYLSEGRPLIALRTSSHAWDTRNRGPQGQVEWKAFDPEVLGGNYHGHHRNGIESKISIVPGMSAHPILTGVNAQRLIGKGSLYKASPLAANTQVLLTGKIVQEPAEPILWLRRYGGSHIIYTSLGHIGDFEQPHFNRLLKNSVRFLLSVSKR